MGAGEAETSLESTAPGRYGLSTQPNPFNPSTRVFFTLPLASKITLSIYDVQGKLIQHLAEGFYEAGWYNVLWDDSSAASGVYYLRFTALDGLGALKCMKVSKLLLMK